MIRLFVMSVVLPLAPLAAQTVVPAAPVEHRLSPDEIAAAQADGAERNRAAELLAMTHGDAALALPLERPKKVHGEAGVGFGSDGSREIYGVATTAIGDNATATIAGDYTQFGRQRYRSR